MKRLGAIVSVTTLTLFLFVYPLYAKRPLLSCTDLTTDNLALKNVVIADQEAVVDAYGAYCKISGKVNERTGIDGKTYAIGFEMRLPVEWNSRFLYQANGGSDGAVVAATGGVENASGQQVALARGFAVLSTDAGHDGSDPVNADAGLNQGVVFGLDPRARLDYGFLATRTMTPIAKRIIKRHYGKKPAYSYMAGCSNGGRHGMVAASRYPRFFDGILVGDPGFNLPRAAIQHAWDVQSFQLAAPQIYDAFSPADMALIADSVVAACDALDGLVDGMVADLVGCQEVFDLSELTCEGDKLSTCLSPQQVAAMERSMGGPRNSAGEPLYSDWPYDGGMGGGGYRFWKIESGIPPWGNYPLIVALGGGSLSHIFSTPPVEVGGTPEELYTFLTEFDFDIDAPKIYATDPVYKVSAMDFMTPIEVDHPRLRRFEKAGGKMLIYHGQSDPVFSVNDTIDWYETLTANHRGDATDFVRLFVIPNMNHCSGGCATDQFDALTALVEWVEEGQAPDFLIASLDPENEEVPSDWSSNRTRPLCVWPEVAVFDSGDPEAYDSFHCAVPSDEDHWPHHHWRHHHNRHHPWRHHPGSHPR
ncbi:MAG: tannase/feruloyl esterase family alpha/beta hydrolase [Desulfosarcinaceae bacterium]|jgi:feruloyl esterase